MATIDGTASDESITGTTDNDSIAGLAGDDSIFGLEGDDTLVGNMGADTLVGGDGNDVLNVSTGGFDQSGDGPFTGSDPDRVFGGAGDDRILGGFGADTIDGGEGIDEYSQNLRGSANPVNVDLAAGTAVVSGITQILLNIENVLATSGNDTVVGDAGANLLQTADGDDVISGGAGNDTLNGGLGNETLIGGDGDDVFEYQPGDGADTIQDFNAGTTGSFDDKDPTNNDFVDLSGFYDHISELRADYDDDGILNQSNDGGSVNYSNNASFGSGSLLLAGLGSSNELTNENTAVVCFAKGTMITTADRDRPVETLAKGDLVLTADHGLRPVRWVGSRVIGEGELMQNPKLRPVRIAAGALGTGMPERDLLVSPQHRVLIRSEIAIRIFGSHEVLVPAKKLLSVKGIEIDYGVSEVEYFHVLFDHHEIVWSNGAMTESLYTGYEALKSMSAEAVEEITEIFPEFFLQDYKPFSARDLPSSRKLIKKLAIRHKLHRKPLVSG